MNRRVLLVFGAIAVAAAAVILYIAIDADDSSAATTASSASATAGSAEPTERPTARRRPADGSGSSATAQPPVKEYVVGDRRIRDHRTGDRPPPAEARTPAADPNRGRKLAVPVTTAIGGKFQEVFHECMKLVPKQARGEKPRLTGTLFVAVKDQQVTITGTELAFSNLTGDSVGAAKQCIEEKSVGVSTGATAEADIERYAISLSLAVR